MFVFLLVLTFKSGIWLTFSCSAGLKSSFFFKMHDIPIIFYTYFYTALNIIEFN